MSSSTGPTEVVTTVVSQAAEPHNGNIIIPAAAGGGSVAVIVMVILALVVSRRRRRMADIQQPRNPWLEQKSRASRQKSYTTRSLVGKTPSSCWCEDNGAAEEPARRGESDTSRDQFFSIYGNLELQAASVAKTSLQNSRKRAQTSSTSESLGSQTEDLFYQVDGSPDPPETQLNIEQDGNAHNHTDVKHKAQFKKCLSSLVSNFGGSTKRSSNSPNGSLATNASYMQDGHSLAPNNSPPTRPAELLPESASPLSMDSFKVYRNEISPQEDMYTMYDSVAASAFRTVEPPPEVPALPTTEAAYYLEPSETRAIPSEDLYSYARSL